VTHTVAATSTNAPGTFAVLFAGFVLFVTLGYAVECWIKPFTHCHRCHGTGDSPRRLTDRLRYGPAGRPRAARARPACPHCRGTGLRLRIGRRVYNHLSRIRRDATR
jgi:hypothetical protein